MSSNIMKYNVYERASVGGNLDTFNDISKVVIPSSGYMKSPGGNGCHTTSTLESTLGIHKESSKVSKQTHIVEELNESGDVEYHCTACRKRFRSRTQKYYHLDCPHLDERAFECDICKKV